MKLIHTSDWHLGQSFFNRSRQQEHEAFLSWLINTSIDVNADAIIVAGDIFDTSTPPSYARQLYNQFISQLHPHNIQLLVLGGNHDSVAVLNESRGLLKSLNTHVVSSTSLHLDEQLVVLPTKEGKPGAIVCAVPYVRPHDVLQTQAGQSADKKNKDLGEAISSHYAQLFNNAKDKREEIYQQHKLYLPIVATGHLAAVGVAQSDSVRDIYIGSLNGFSSKSFPPADYIALGHIHKPQQVGKHSNIRYSGSPIPLSFDEINTQKQISIIEFTPSHKVSDTCDQSEGIQTTISSFPIPLFQKLLVLKGDLKSIMSQIDELKMELESVKTSKQNSQSIWASIHIEHQDYLLDLQAQIQDRIGDSKIDVLQIKRIQNQQRVTLEKRASETLEELSPSEVFEQRLAMESFDDEQQISAIRKRFEQILSLAVQNDEQADNNETKVAKP